MKETLYKIAMSPKNIFYGYVALIALMSAGCLVKIYGFGDFAYYAVAGALAISGSFYVLMAISAKFFRPKQD